VTSSRGKRRACPIAKTALASSTRAAVSASVGLSRSAASTRASIAGSRSAAHHDAAKASSGFDSALARSNALPHSTGASIAGATYSGCVAHAAVTSASTVLSSHCDDFLAWRSLIFSCIVAKCTYLAKPYDAQEKSASCTYLVSAVQGLAQIAP